MRVSTFIVAAILVKVCFAQTLHYDTRTDSRQVYRLDLGQSLNYHQNFIQTFQLPFISEIISLLKKSDQVLYFEFDEKHRSSIRLYHNDNELSHESEWLNLLASFLGSPKPLFIDGVKHWSFSKKKNYILKYQAHVIQVFDRYFIQGKKEKKESRPFYWKEQSNLHLSQLFNTNFPILNAWFDFKKNSKKNAYLDHFLNLYGIASMNAFLSLGFKEQGLQLSARSLIEENPKLDLSQFIPEANKNWNYAASFPPDPDIYFEFSGLNASELLEQLRNIIYDWGLRPGKEFDRDLIDYEDTYGFKVEEDLLNMFSRGAGLAFYGPEHPDYQNKHALWAMTLSFPSRELFNNILHQFPDHFFEAERPKEYGQSVTLNIQQKSLYLLWTESQLYLGNDQRIINKMESLSKTERIDGFQLPKKLKQFYSQPAGFGHRLFLNERFIYKFCEEVLFKDIRHTSKLPNEILNPYKEQLLAWLEQNKYWLLWQLSSQDNQIHLDAYLDKDFQKN